MSVRLCWGVEELRLRVQKEVGLGVGQALKSQVQSLYSLLGTRSD